MVRATYVAHDYSIGPAGAHEWLGRRALPYHEKTTTTPPTQPPPRAKWQNPPADHGHIAHPPVKPWSKTNKDFLQELIDTGKVNIGRSADTKYIDRVRAKYFRDRDEHNFRRNFRSYARSRELEDRLSGYHRQGGGIVFFYILFLLFTSLLMSPPLVSKLQTTTTTTRTRTRTSTMTTTTTTT